MSFKHKNDITNAYADIVILIILCYKENKQNKQKNYRKLVVACKMYDYAVRYKLLIFI